MGIDNGSTSYTSAIFRSTLVFGMKDVPNRFVVVALFGEVGLQGCVDLPYFLLDVV